MKGITEYMRTLLECGGTEEEEVNAKSLKKEIKDLKDDVKDAKEEAKDAKEDAKEADKEANKSEESIKSEKDFRSYAENKFKEVFGDKLDKDQMKKTIDGLLSENKDAVDKGDWGTLVGMLNKSFGGK